MADVSVSVDEFLAARKDFVKSGDVIMKASKAPSSWNAEQRTARFVMSAEIEDRDRDIVVQAGIDLDGFLKNPVAPFAHQSRTFPVGTWADVEKVLTGRPKRTEGTLKLVPEGTDEVADRLAKHIGAGTIRACSIGFIPKAIKRRDVPDDKKDEPYYFPGYSIEAAELVECSPCVVPSNPASFAKDAEGDDRVLGRELVEEILDNWAKHPETGLIVPRIEFEAAYRELATPKTHVAISMSPDQATELKTALERSPAGELVAGRVNAQHLATGEQSSAGGTPQSGAAPAAVPLHAEPGLVRRAIDYVLGRGEAPAEGVVITGDQLKEQRHRIERQEAAELAVRALRRAARLHNAQYRLAAVRSRLEAQGLK